MLGLAGAAAAGGTLVTGGTATAEAKAVTATVATADDLRSLTGAAGDQVYVVGHTVPGRGGGVFYWDATSTAADDDGTVFAVAGVATGRWRRPVAARVDLAWFGWDGTGTSDDAPLLRKAIAALPNGGTVEIGPGLVRVATTVRIESRPITLQGAGLSDIDAYGTQIVLATGTADGFVFAGSRGGGMRDLQVRGQSLQGGSMVRTERFGTGEGNGNYMMTFSNVRFRLGYNGITLRGCNTIRFLNCVWNEFSGQQVILLNGVDDDSRADPVEFVQCAIAAGSENDGTDVVVMDGKGGSAKFIACAILHGRNGIWLRNTTTGAPPKFVYVEGGGFENSQGTPLLLDAGSQFTMANAYVSSDGRGDCVRMSSTFLGAVAITGCIIRGGWRHGVDIASSRVTLTGNVIGNNGAAAHTDEKYSRVVTGAANNGSGKVRITTAAAHGWETDDTVTLTAVGGTTEANGTWRITVVDATRFDLPVDVTHAYTGGGLAYRHGSGVNIRAGASRVVLTGNAIGGLAEGTNRQEYGVRNAAADVLVTGNDLSGNVSGPYQLTGTQTRATRFVGNKGVEQLDGWLTASVPGAVGNADHDFANLLYLVGQRIRVTRVAARLGAGSCTIELISDTTRTGVHNVSTTLTSGTLDTPFIVDATSDPKRLRVRIAGASSASDLEVQFGYQVVS